MSEGFLDLVVENEQALYGDIVELDCQEEYRALTWKSMLLYDWLDRNSQAQYFMRVDDDVYLRPLPLLEQLRQRTPVRYWWGSFSHFSWVVRNETDWKHYNDPEDQQMTFSKAEYFPMYARGPLMVMSMDLISLIVQRFREGDSWSAFPDDSALGVSVLQLLGERGTFVNVDDRDKNRLSLNPYCKHGFSPLTTHTWAVHHVSPRQVHCMFQRDLEEGYYEQAEPLVPEYVLEALDTSREVEVQIKYLSEAGPMPGPVTVRRRRRNGFPDLCPCATSEEEEDPGDGREKEVYDPNNIMP
jgi:hypothetical protein